MTAASNVIEGMLEFDHFKCDNLSYENTIISRRPQIETNVSLRHSPVCAENKRNFDAKITKTTINTF